VRLAANTARPDARQPYRLGVFDQALHDHAFHALNIFMRAARLLQQRGSHGGERGARETARATRSKEIEIERLVRHQRQSRRNLYKGKK